MQLKNGDVIKIIDTVHGIKIKNQIEKILHLGDILISFGDFLENNAELVPTGYVEEIWLQELKEKLAKYETENSNSFSKFLTTIPSFDEAIELSLNFLIPLHPKYLYFWDRRDYRLTHAGTTYGDAEDRPTRWHGRESAG